MQTDFIYSTFTFGKMTKHTHSEVKGASLRALKQHGVEVSSIRKGNTRVKCWQTSGT